jgi:hypothetical protein
MQGNSSFPGPGNIERELMKQIDSNEEASRQKKKYKRGVTLGLIVIFLATAAFVVLMVMMPDEFSPVYLAGCGFAVLVMTGSIVAVSIWLRRLQAEYFGSAGEAAEEYAEEFVRSMRTRK